MTMPALFKGRLSIPVIGAPLFIISVPDLVIAQCKSGVVGAFPALNARPPELLDEARLDKSGKARVDIVRIPSVATAPAISVASAPQIVLASATAYGPQADPNLSLSEERPA